eukprot:jgi/Psemu1/248713/estExt_Genewise1.C_24810004
MDEEGFQYTDDEEEANDSEVALENAYYNSKGLRETNLQEAAEAFEQVIIQEREELASNNESDGDPPKYGPWSYKSIKQLVKLQLRMGTTESVLAVYSRLLECIAEGNVSPNAVEKGINGMLERLALTVYDSTLRVFHPTSGSCPNERLWFKTNLKYGQLLYETNETAKLQQVLRDLQTTHNIMTDGGTSSSSSNTQSIEIYALQIQLYSRQKDNKKLREVFKKAMAVRGGIPHPRTLASIQELGGKMHMQAKEYEAAGKTFFQAFKSYDEAGDQSRLRCLKYLVLASMLHASSINPFDSQEARPYRDDPEIAAMTNLVQAFQNNEIHKFERILKQNKERIMGDEFVREHVEDLLRTIRTQVLRRVIKPYTRISLDAISRELNNIPVSDVENLLVGLILDGSLDGRLDQVSGLLLKKAEKGGSGSSNNDARGTVANSASSNVSLVSLKFEAMSQIAAALEEIASSTANSRMGEGGTGMRGMVH